MENQLKNSSRLRSLKKTITWRIVATAITWVIVYLFTEQISETTYITATTAAFLMFAYYLHERAWNRAK